MKKRKMTGTRFLSRTSAFLRESGGQDLVEYALLMAFFAFAGLAAAPMIEAAIGAAYVAYDTGNQDLWVPPDPAAP